MLQAADFDVLQAAEIKRLMMLTILYGDVKGFMHPGLSLQVAQQQVVEEHPHHTSPVCPISLQTIGEPPCATG